MCVYVGSTSQRASAQRADHVPDMGYGGGGADSFIQGRTCKRSPLGCLKCLAFPSRTNFDFGDGVMWPKNRSDSGRDRSRGGGNHAHAHSAMSFILPLVRCLHTLRHCFTHRLSKVAY